MSETLLTVVAVAVFIGGPFFLLWLIGRRRQANEEQPARPVGRRILRLLGILAVGIVVIVTVFYGCTWVMVAQPTVGKLSLTTVVVSVVIVGFSILIIMQYLGLLAEIVSSISRITRKPSAERTETTTDTWTEQGDGR